MSLQQLSDKDLDRLYNDAKAGIRKGTDYSENDGDDFGGYTPDDFYTGQTMSSDYGDIGGKKETELMELSKMYSDSVYTDYEGGRLGNESIREGFNKIFDEKERRRVQYIDDGRYKPPAAEEAAKPKPENKSAVEPYDKPEVKVPLNDMVLKEENKSQISGFAGSTWNPEGGTEAPGAADYSKAKEKAQSFQVSSGKPDYSFQGGSYGSAPAMGNSNYGAKPAATDGVAGGSSADAYGNVPAGNMNAEHEAEQLKNSHLGKVKGALGSL